MTNRHEVNWRDACGEGLRTGAVASVASTLALMAAGHGQARDWAAPTNATSQWIWGGQALRADGGSLRHTLTGYLIHHGASVFWAVLYAAGTERLPVRQRPGAAIAAGLATAAIACVADYRLTPHRFTPGFEQRISRGALALVYGVFGLSIALASLAWRARRERTAAGMRLAAGRGSRRPP